MTRWLGSGELFSSPYSLLSLSFPCQNTKVSFYLFFYFQFSSYSFDCYLFFLYIFFLLIFLFSFVPHHLVFFNTFLNLFFFNFILSMWFQIIFISNLVPILLIIISFVLDPFLLHFFFQFHPLIFWWFRILLCYFVGFVFCWVTLGLMTRVTDFEG
jgi:hypothetical protein